MANGYIDAAEQIQSGTESLVGAIDSRIERAGEDHDIPIPVETLALIKMCLITQRTVIMRLVKENQRMQVEIDSLVAKCNKQV